MKLPVELWPTVDAAGKAMGLAPIAVLTIFRGGSFGVLVPLEFFDDA